MGLITIAAILIILFAVLTAYFTFSFMEALHQKDERIVKQYKISALICFGITMLCCVGFAYVSLVFNLL